MFIKASEKGQALILIALAAIVLFGFSALAIDGTRAFSDKRHAQNAADTAVLAAALAKIRGQDFAVAATARATSNGYTHGANTKVQVNLCSDALLDEATGAPVIDPVTGSPVLIDCQGLPAGLPTAKRGEYIRVRIISTLPTTFMRVLGRQTVKSAVEAVAHVEGSTSSSTGSLFGGAAMVATKGGNYNQCFLMNGGADVYTHDSGIYVNCSGSQALFMNGGAHLDMDAAGQVVGGYGFNGGAQFDPITTGVNGGVSQTINASTFASVPTTQAPPTCSSNAPAPVGNVYSPGNYTNIIINGGINATMNPGVYCISGNFILNGSATLSGPNGRVQIVLQDQNIVLNGGTTIDFNDLEIYGRNASFLLNGNAIFRASRLRYFSTGTGTFTVNGGSELTSGDAYLYLHRGNIVWNGNSILNLHAPMQGDPFAGLLIHKPWENNSGVTLNGGSSVHLTGTFLVPASPVTYNGGVHFELHSQIIGYTFIANGGGDVDIYFVASENYQPPNTSNPTIELTK